MTPADFRARVQDPRATIDAIAALLDAATPEERLAAAHSLGRADQRALYGKAKASAPLTLADFVPEDRAPLVPVHHRGRNTMPLWGIQHFEKRFCRPKDGTQRLFGYNEFVFGPLIGPGYFVAVPTAGNGAWEERGAVVVDYFQVPDGPVTAEWPRVVPNSRGLQFFVYNRTRDFMRRVSRHVSIGAAYKNEKAMDQYFVLVKD